MFEMEGVAGVKRSGSGSGKRALLLRTGSTKEEEESCGEVARPGAEDLPFEALDLSRRLVRSVSAKWKRKKEKIGLGNNDNNAKVRDESNGEDGAEKMVHSSCLCLYGQAGGCKVGADTTTVLPSFPTLGLALALPSPNLAFLAHLPSSLLPLCPSSSHLCRTLSFAPSLILLSQTHTFMKAPANVAATETATAMAPACFTILPCIHLKMKKR